jgi:hypothetical protein
MLEKLCFFLLLLYRPFPVNSTRNRRTEVDNGQREIYGFPHSRGQTARGNQYNAECIIAYIRHGEENMSCHRVSRQVVSLRFLAGVANSGTRPLLGSRRRCTGVTPL